MRAVADLTFMICLDVCKYYVMKFGCMQILCDEKWIKVKYFKYFIFSYKEEKTKNTNTI